MAGRNDTSKRKQWRHGKKGGSITVDPAKNFADVKDNVSSTVEKEINNTIGSSNKRVSVPIGQYSSARLPGQYGTILAGDELNALDVISETNYKLNINGTRDRLDAAMEKQENKIDTINAEDLTASNDANASIIENNKKVAEETQTKDPVSTKNTASETKEESKPVSTVKKKQKPVQRETSTEKIQASLDLFNDTNWDQNILHDYESVTYDITFAMANKQFTRKFFDRESAMSSGFSTDGEVFEKESNYDSNDLLKNYDDTGGDKVIIVARSAETVTTISSLEFKNVLGMTRADRSNLGMEIRMSITQPQSTNLIKQIFLASQELGIERYQTFPFFIQVYLKGRKKDGTLVGGYDPHLSVGEGNNVNAAKMNAAGQEIPGTRRLYAMLIRNMQYKVDVGGAVYDIEGIRYGDTARVDDHVLVSDIRMSNIKNFKDFCERFPNEIVQQQQHELGITKYLMDKYSIVVQGSNSDEIEKVLESKIISDVEDKTQILNKDLDTDGVLTEIDYDASITEVIEKHLTRTEYFVKNIKGIQQKLSEINNMADDELEKWDDIAIGKKAFTITPVADPLQFDPLRNDYQRTFRYVIYISDWASVQSGILQEYNAPPERHKKRVSAMMQNAVLSKKYSYLYTGDNIDVMDFDLTYNFQYVYPYDQLHGIFKDLPDAMRSKILNRAKDLARHDKAKNEMKIDFNKMAQDGKIDEVENRQILQARRRFLQEYTSVLEAGAVEPDAGTLIAYENLVQQYNNDIQKYNKKVSEAGIELKSIESFKAVADNNQSNRSSSAPLEIKLGGRWQLAETLTRLNEKSSETLAGAISAQFYARTSDQQGGITDVGNDQNAEAQRILENAFAGGPSVDLMNVSMDVIGDPYWLPHPEIDALEKTLNNLGVAADPKSENMVLFQTLFPKEVDKETGFIPPAASRTDEILTSLYRVYRIEHRFDNGQFTQRLHMQRDALTDLSFVTGQRKDKSGGIKS